MFTRRLLIGLVAVAAISMPTTGRAQDRDSGPDIGVMKSVLTELVSKVYGKDGVDVNGAYLPERGLFFVVSPPNNFNIEIDMSSFDSAMANFSVSMKHFDSTMAHWDSSMTHGGTVGPVPRVTPVPQVHVVSTGKKPPHDYSEAEQKAVMRFLESYADAENALRPGDEIIIVLLGDGESPARVFEVSKKAISDARAGGSTENSLEGKVKVTTVGHGEESESVEIMQTILDKSLREGGSGYGFNYGGGDTRGIYLKGLGALFICSQNDFSWSFGSGRERESRRKDTTGTGNRIIRILGTYGPTLRFMPDNESIYVFVARNSFGDGGNNLLVAVTKKDVDAFARNEISLETLRSSATVIRTP